MTHPTDNDPDLKKEQRAFMLREDSVARWLVIVQANHLSCDFVLYQAIGYRCGQDDCPLFDSRGSAISVAPWSNNSRPALTGFVNWDGCTGFEAGGLRFSEGARSYEELHDVIQVAMEKAYDLMTIKSRLQANKELGWTLPVQRNWIRFSEVAHQLPETWNPNHQTGTTTNA